MREIALGIFLILIFPTDSYSHVTPKSTPFCCGGRWLGVPTLQHPLDVWIIQEIISEQKPDWVIETGTFEGGSALVWATIASAANSNAKVITVDKINRVKDAALLKLWKDKVIQIQGESASVEVLNRILETVRPDEGALVILDSDHSCAHVLNELRLYSKLILKGGYMVVQDMQLDEAWQFEGPTCGVNKFLEENKNFKRSDLSNRFLSSNIKGGVLEKVRDD